MGTLDSLFTMQLTGQYGHTLSLSGLLDFAELQLSASALVNLTANPRAIQRIQFAEQLNSPFSGTVPGGQPRGWLRRACSRGIH